MANSKKIAFLFPGQGAQYVGMGKEFFTHSPHARLIFEEANEFLGQKLHKLMFEGNEAELTKTRTSQLAIYVLSMAIMKSLQNQLPEIVPFVCSGLSLGEYSALCASNHLSFMETLKIIQLRAQFMNDACERTQGTMAVIMGLDADTVENMVKELNLPHDLWVANFNCPGQVVISGTSKGIEKGTAAAQAKGAKRILPLQVHGAFHSGLMKEAEERLSPFLKQLPLTRGSAALVMNVPGSIVEDLDEIQRNLILQVSHSVRWEQGVRSMNHWGIDLFLEIGCGKTLCGFNKRIAVSAPSISIERPEDIHQLEKFYKDQIS